MGLDMGAWRTIPIPERPRREERGQGLREGGEERVEWVEWVGIVGVVVLWVVRLVRSPARCCLTLYRASCTYLIVLIVERWGRSVGAYRVGPVGDHNTGFDCPCPSLWAGPRVWVGVQAAYAYSVSS